MTHIGDNPFVGGSSQSIDDELEALLKSGTGRDEEIEKLDERSFKTLSEMLPIVDSFGVERLFDVDTDKENELQEARMAAIRTTIEEDLLSTEEGAALYASGDFHAIVEFRSSMALIEERRLQKYITMIAMTMCHVYEDASDKDKMAVLEELEFDKRVYLLLLLEHYELDPHGWPAVFDAITPGVGLQPGIDLDEYRLEADKHAQSIVLKDKRERRELEEVGARIGVNTLTDTDEVVSVMVTLAAIQECADDIEMIRQPNAPAQRGEMIWELATQGGLPPEACQTIAEYYDEKRPLAA